MSTGPSTRDFAFPLNVFAHVLERQEGRVDYLHFAAFEQADLGFHGPGGVLGLLRQRACLDGLALAVLLPAHQFLLQRLDALLAVDRHGEAGDAEGTDQRGADDPDGARQRGGGDCSNPSQVLTLSTITEMYTTAGTYTATLTVTRIELSRRRWKSATRVLVRISLAISSVLSGPDLTTMIRNMSSL